MFTGFWLESWVDDLPVFQNPSRGTLVTTKRGEGELEQSHFAVSQAVGFTSKFGWSDNDSFEVREGEDGFAENNDQVPQVDHSFPFFRQQGEPVD